MIDLTNKTLDEINALIQKYAPVLELTKHINHIPILAYIYDISINYIKESYSGLTADWKSWAVFVVNKNYFYNKITMESDIKTTIDDFFNYHIQHYNEYCQDLISASDYDRESGFVNKYLNKKR